jgi:hypothetical protein
MKTIRIFTLASLFLASGAISYNGFAQTPTSEFPTGASATQSKPAMVVKEAMSKEAVTAPKSVSAPITASVSDLTIYSKLYTQFIGMLSDEGKERLKALMAEYAPKVFLFEAYENVSVNHALRAEWNCYKLFNFIMEHDGSMDEKGIDLHGQVSDIRKAISRDSAKFIQLAKEFKSRIVYYKAVKVKYDAVLSENKIKLKKYEDTPEKLFGLVTGIASFVGLEDILPSGKYTKIQIDGFRYGAWDLRNELLLSYTGKLLRESWMRYEDDKVYKSLFEDSEAVTKKEKFYESIKFLKYYK